MSVSPHPSVNGEKQDGGFHGVEGEVFPCAGSYRTGVSIRLLKVGPVRFEYAVARENDGQLRGLRYTKGVEMHIGIMLG